MTSPLDSLPFLQHLTDSQRSLWLAPPTPVDSGKVIVSQDMPSDEAPRPSDDEVYFVVKGNFEVSTYSENGTIVFYRMIGPGGLFGELAAIDGDPRSATVTAKSDGLLVCIAGADFKNLIETSPHFAGWLVGRHTALIRSLTLRLYEQIAYDVATRIMAELVRLAKDAGVVGNQARIMPIPTHGTLATRLGTTREAVTRVMNHLGAPTKKKPGEAQSKKAKKGEKRESLNLIKQTGRELLIRDFEALQRVLRERTTTP